MTATGDSSQPAVGADARATDPPALEAWAGVECSHLRTPAGQVDQLSATGHDRREDDLERLASLGVAAARYPVLWGRGPSGTVVPETDWRWAEARLDRLRALG